jgi:hypothetical protein
MSRAPGGSASLSSFYVRSDPMSDFGRILADPDDRQGFIEGVRKFAPRAEFEL